MVIGRFIRVVLLVRSIRIVLLKDGFQRSMRLQVGGNKRRYQKDGYDLDLSLAPLDSTTGLYFNSNLCFTNGDTSCK